ncbi:hypothetical protein [Gemmatirosa kalamazoonensis]|uniref:hypothetical protein n=1 Tax=Gemmatirosa kalamazoonensis TaxID=861299 RepID=UPI0011DC77BC|nr:hypothetical protein [Gemmatirosa kalamazoonensis]
MRRPRILGAPVVGVSAALLACARPRPLSDLPSRPDGGPTAVFALRARQCDANVATLRAFDRRTVRGRVTLAGVLLLDGDSAAAGVRSQLRAFDVDVPLVHVSAPTRDSLATLIDRAGPSVVVYTRAYGEVLVLPSPQSTRQLVAFHRTLETLALRRLPTP